MIGILNSSPVDDGQGFVEVAGPRRPDGRIIFHVRNIGGRSNTGRGNRPGKRSKNGSGKELSQGMARQTKRPILCLSVHRSRAAPNRPDNRPCPDAPVIGRRIFTNTWVASWVPRVAPGATRISLF